MMLKRLLLIGSLAVVLVFAALSQAAYAEPLSSERQSRSLDEVKRAILVATGYDPAAVELTATHVQFIVTLVNSKLAAGPASPREVEASRITTAIAGVITEMPEFKGIQAIHIDYVSRKPDGSASRIIDGIYFRKDPQG
ncbi:MAG: hypothetical protein WA633_19990, partial [Stellaceae bacterium]